MPTEQHEQARESLGLELMRHGRLMHLAKAEMAHRTDTSPQGLDFASLGLLMTLTRCGATRQGELADEVMLTPSTVSRYVTQLVRAGLVERRPDPDDGRAVQLIASHDGLDLAERLAQHRRDVLSETLHHWSADDLTRLSDLLRRLNDDLEQLRNRSADPNGATVTARHL